MSVYEKMRAIADAIREKTNSPNLLSLDDMALEIRSLQTGGGLATAEEKDVNFYDYDGTCLYSYTLSEAMLLTELPPLPEHDGLTCQGWNWTLADIKSFAEPLDVGASYITDNGATRLYLNIPTSAGLTVPLYIQQTVAKGVTIDWGDGSATETIAGTGAVTTTHTYASTGKYCLTLLPSASCTMQLGNGTLNVVGRENDYSKPTRVVICKAEIGRGVTQISTNAFNYATGLETITIPQGVTRISTRGFQYCQILKFIVLPSGCTNIDTSAFTTCNRINMISIPKSLSSFGGSSPCSEMASHKRVILPDTVNYLGATAFSGNRALQNVRLSKNITSIGGNAFDNCWNLKELDVPAKVTSIAALAFRYCYSLGRLRFNSTTPPTVANSNAFTNIPTDCIVEVPAGTLATYQAATNYGTIAAQMVEV